MDIKHYSRIHWTDGQTPLSSANLNVSEEALNELLKSGGYIDQLDVDIQEVSTNLSTLSDNVSDNFTTVNNSLNDLDNALEFEVSRATQEENELSVSVNTLETTLKTEITERTTLQGTVTELQSQVAGKADSDALKGKADAIHEHTLSDITDSNTVATKEYVENYVKQNVVESLKVSIISCGTSLID